MRIVGLVGGTGWISTAEYYRYINEEANRRRGGLHFIECILYSLDYGEIDALKRAEPRVGGVPSDPERRERAGGGRGQGARALREHDAHVRRAARAGAFRAHHPHRGCRAGREINAKGLRTVGLLGTRLTMELDFYKKRLQTMGIETIVPEAEDREFIEQAINAELLKGVFKPETKDGFLQYHRRPAGKGGGGDRAGVHRDPAHRPRGGCGSAGFQHDPHPLAGDRGFCVGVTGREARPSAHGNYLG